MGRVIAAMFILCMGCAKPTVDARPEDAGVDAASDRGTGTDGFTVDTGTCLPTSCESAGVVCGSLSDGCGGTLECGSCPAGMSCSAGACSMDPEGPVDCSPIESAAGFELCESSATHCAGVYTDGSNCDAFCGAAGLRCRGQFGGEPGCMVERDNNLGCGIDTGNESDWCECEREAPPVDPDCSEVAADPPRLVELGFRAAAYSPRTSWVLDCREYAYTAQFEEHEACDSQYRAGSGRGTATFILDLPRGMYDLFIAGRHTENRNPSGMIVNVISDGMTRTARIDQRDDRGVVDDLHGRYCLGGEVTVVVDSTGSGASDSVSAVRVVPAE